MEGELTVSSPREMVPTNLRRVTVVRRDILPYLQGEFPSPIAGMFSMLLLIMMKEEGERRIGGSEATIGLGFCVGLTDFAELPVGLLLLPQDSNERARTNAR